MQLRAHTRLPGRYREDDIPPLPSTAKFVHPTAPYSPNLPPAAFPTLDVPRLVALPLPEAMDVDGSESSNSPLEGELPQRPAAVFRGKGKAPRISSPEVIQHAAEEEAERPEPEDGFRHPQLSVSSEDPGEFEAIGLNIDGEGQDKNESIGLPAYEQLDDWKYINNGLKLVILTEMMKNHSLKHVTKILILSAEEIEEIYDLHEREALRQAEEDARIGKAQARQLETLMRGAFATNRDRISTLFADNVYANLKPPDMFVFSRKEIQQAQRFLNNLKLFEYGDRLWRYQGVAMVPNLVCMHTNGPSSLFESSGSPGDRLHLQALQPGPSQNANEPQLNIQTGSSRKRKQLPSNGKQLLSASRGRKRLRTSSRIVKMKVPASSLRNMITAEDQEVAVALAPAALQESSPILPLAPLTPKLPETPKGSGSPQVRFKPLSNKLSPSTSPPPQVATSVAPAPTLRSGQIPQSPDSATENQVNNWLSSHNDPCSPLPALISATSAAQPTSKLIEAELPSAEARPLPFKSPNIQVSPTEVDLTPSNSTWLQMAPAETRSTPSKPPESPEGPNSQLSSATAPTTPFRPPKSPKSPEPRLSYTGAPPTPSKSGEQHRSRSEAQLTPSEPRMPQVPPLEAGMALPESPHLRVSPAEAGLTLSEPPLLHMSPDESQLMFSESPQQQRSPFKAELPPSKPPQLQTSPVQSELTPSKPPEIQMSPAEKRFAMVAKRLGKTAVLSALNGTPIELSTPPRAPSIGASPETLAEETRSAQKNVKVVKALLPAHVVSPASPDPLTGEAQTREPAKKPEPEFRMKTLGRAGFENLKTTIREPVTPTKKPKRVEVRQERSKPSKKSMVKPMNGITKEQVTNKGTPLKATEKSATAAATNGTDKIRDKEDKCSKAAAARLKDRALPNENGLPNRKRERLHDPDDDQDL